MKITARDNQRLKKARKVRDGKIPDLLFIEGVRLTEEALRSKLIIEEAFFSENFLRENKNPELLKQIKTRVPDIFEIPEKLLNSIADTKKPQGFILIAKKPPTGKEILENSIARKITPLPLILLLDEINNPSNLGAIIRTSEAAGVNGIILTRNSADPFSSKALRGSMGSAFRLPVWTKADFDSAIRWSIDSGLSPVCADIRSQTNYARIDWEKPRLLVLGSEANGLSEAKRKLVGESLFIPMENEVESLNLAVSAGIILFEAKRQNSA